MRKRGVEVDHSNIYDTIAGLVISFCVGLIVFALLFRVTDHIDEKVAALSLVNQILGFWDKLTIASQGSVMIVSFSLEVELPFLLFSVVKFKKLPKAGY